MYFASIAAVLGLRVNETNPSKQTSADSMQAALPAQMLTRMHEDQPSLTPAGPVAIIKTATGPAATAMTSVFLPKEQKPFMFFGLPRELRNEIYEYLSHAEKLAGPDLHYREFTITSSPDCPQAKGKIVLPATRPQLVSRQFRREYLAIWAELHVHDLHLNLDFWRLIHVKDAPPLDIPIATPWSGRQMINAKVLAEALYIQLRSYLQYVESHYGVAQRVRHIKIQAKILQSFEHLLDAQHPLHMVAQVPILRTSRRMQRLDDSVAHANLVVELVVSATNQRESSRGPSVWWPARRTAVFQQAHGIGADGARIRAEQDWVLVSDVTEQKTFHTISGASRDNLAGGWAWEVLDD